MNKKYQKSLIDIYNQTSKHSHYQVLPNELSKILPKNKLKINSRFEKERINFIVKNINIKNKKILDIGGNTGFFAFESLRIGGKSVTFIEGNRYHYNFVKLSSKILGKKINAINKYINFSKKDELTIKNNYDITFLLNVLHHIGDDFGQKNVKLEKAKAKIIENINYFTDKTKILILQIGFNWKGDKNMCLFKNGTKEEMINFIKKGTKNYWDILKIGIAENKNNRTIYKELNKNNIQRNNKIGEFRNRPIFILKSKKYES